MQYKVLKECIIESIFYQKGQLYQPSKKMSNFALEALLRHGFLKQAGQSTNFKGGEMYRYLSSEGLVGVGTWGEHPLIDNARLEIGNVMKTQKETTRAKKWLRAFNTLREDMNGFKPNYGDTTQDKYTVCYNAIRGGLVAQEIASIKYNFICFRSEEDVLFSIKEHSEEWMIYLGEK